MLVVGGGDSAVEAAIALGAGSQVTLSYRGKQLSRCKAKNRQQLDELEGQGRIRVLFNSNVTEIEDGHVSVKVDATVQKIANDHVFVCIGGDAPVKWLENVGVRFTETDHMAMRPPTDQVVEALTGPLTEVSAEDAGGGHSQAVVVDFDSIDGASGPRTSVEKSRHTSRSIHAARSRRG